MIVQLKLRIEIDNAVVPPQLAAIDHDGLGRSEKRLGGRADLEDRARIDWRATTLAAHAEGRLCLDSFSAAEAVDELFLTLSPQIAGRAARTNRQGIVQGVEFAPNSAPWYQLLSLRQRADHLYLRYQFKRGGITE